MKETMIKIIFITLISFENYAIVFANESHCLTCGWITPNEAQIENSTNHCENLVSAACLNSKGESKYLGKEEQYIKNVLHKIKKSRQNTIRSMGYKNFYEIISTKLNKLKLTIRNNISQKGKNILLNKSFSTYMSSNEIFETPFKASNDLSVIDTQYISYLGVNEMDKLKEIHEKYKNYISLYKNELLHAYSYDLDAFVRQISDQCQLFKDNSFTLAQNGAMIYPEILKLKEICRNKTKIQSEISELYKIKKESDDGAKSLQFVTNHYPFLEIDIKTFAQNSLSSSESKNQTVDPLKTQIIALRSQSYLIKSRLENIYSSAPFKVIDSLFHNINLSKPTVEGIIQQIYSNQRVEKMEQILIRIKKEMSLLLPQLITSQHKINAIYKNLSDLQLSWIKKPKSLAYQKIYDRELNIEFNVLNLNKLELNDPTLIAFIDSKYLSFFTELNAFFLPNIKVGNIQIDTSVTMMPLFVEMLDDNPWGVIAVLSHEVGHLIGPLISKINGYDLMSEYETLLSCLSQSNSIKMITEQMDESIADFISAELTSSILSELPQEKRLIAAFASLGPNCIFIEFNNKYLINHFESIHPHSFLRLSGIWGGNKSFRELISCPVENSPVRVCSLK